MKRCPQCRGTIVRRCRRKASCRAIDGARYCPSHAQQSKTRVVIPRPTKVSKGRANGRCSCKTREGLRCSRHTRTRTKLCWQHTKRCLEKWGTTHRSTQTKRPSAPRPLRRLRRKSVQTIASAPQRRRRTQHRSTQTSPHRPSPGYPRSPHHSSTQTSPHRPSPGCKYPRRPHHSSTQTSPHRPSPGCKYPRRPHLSSTQTSPQHPSPTAPPWPPSPAFPSGSSFRWSASPKSFKNTPKDKNKNTPKNKNYEYLIEPAGSSECQQPDGQRARACKRHDIHRWRLARRGPSLQ